MIKGCRKTDSVQFVAGETRDYLGFDPAALRRRGRKQIRRDDVDSVADRNRNVFILRMERDAEVGRKRPGRGGPDQAVDVLSGQRRIDRGGVRVQSKTNPNRWALVVLVFDFGLGQRRPVVDAPVDRLQSLIYIALVENVDERPGDHRLIGRIHRQVRIVPAAHDAEALEILPLEIDPLFGVLAAGPADLNRRHLRLLTTQLLIDFVFYGEAMAVPSGNVWRVVTSHGSGLYDESP